MFWSKWEASGPGATVHTVFARDEPREEGEAERVIDRLDSRQNFFSLFDSFSPEIYLVRLSVDWRLAAGESVRLVVSAARSAWFVVFVNIDCRDSL